MNAFKYFWTCSNRPIYVVKSHIWSGSKIFERIQNILYELKIFLIKQMDWAEDAFCELLPTLDHIKVFKAKNTSRLYLYLNLDLKTGTPQPRFTFRILYKQFRRIWKGGHNSPFIEWCLQSKVRWRKSIRILLVLTFSTLLWG